jgi:hypothetical protein
VGHCPHVRSCRAQPPSGEGGGHHDEHVCHAQQLNVGDGCCACVRRP